MSAPRLPGVSLGPLADYDDKMLLCRAERHDWPIGGPSDHWWEDVDDRGRLVGWWRELTCRRCRAVQLSTMDLEGYLNNKIRRRPRGYRIPKDTGVTAKRYARLARVARQSGPRVVPASAQGAG